MLHGIRWPLWILYLLSDLGLQMFESSLTLMLETRVLWESSKTFLTHEPFVAPDFRCCVALGSVRLA